MCHTTEKFLSYVSCYNKKCDMSCCHIQPPRYFSGLFVYDTNKNVKLEHWLPLPRAVIHSVNGWWDRKHLNFHSHVMLCKLATVRM